MASLADIRARLLEQEQKSKGGNFKQGDSAVYAHWNIDEDMTAITRFLEDGDTSNPYFWVERAMFKFPFNGIKGSTEHKVEASDKPTIVQVPCMEMYGDKDEVLDEVRTWFKDPTLEDMGRKYWKKRTYLFQGFVRDNPMEGKDGFENPENPIRRFMISPQIFTLIKNSLMDPEIENLPTDQDAGLDFRIKKTSKGGYADYSNSSWARKETALIEDEIAAIEKHGLYNLKDFLPKKPTEEVLAVIKEMFEASVEGEAYDVERWGAYYTPYGVSKTNTNNNSKPADKPAESKPAESTESTEASTESASAPEEKSTLEDDVKQAEASVAEKEAKDESTGDAKAQDILAMIRSRQK